MNKTTTELMQPFCDADDSRVHIRNIFKKGDYLYATNGEVAVRMPDDGTVEIVPCDSTNNINLDAILKVDLWPTKGFVPLELTEPASNKKCTACDETGIVFKETDCDECDGRGDFDHGSHNYECLECRGDGKITAKQGDKITCVECNGTGIAYQYLTMPDGRKFNYKYLLKLKELPGICYLLGANDDKYSSMRFKFNNGVGLLMPLRR